jgi:hypothetical protein
MLSELKGSFELILTGVRHINYVLKVAEKLQHDEVFFDQIIAADSLYLNP